MRTATAAWAVTASLVAGSAQAHSFDAGAEGYAQFMEGAGVVLIYPGLLLPVLALGLLLSLWQLEGLPKVWPLFLLGQTVGIGLAVLAGPDIGLALMALGVVTASLAALLPRHIRVEALGLSLLTGALVSMVSFEGHGLFELSMFLHLGLIFGPNLALALSAGLARLALESVTAPWMRIGIRVAASWIGAILLLILAFSVAA